MQINIDRVQANILLKVINGEPINSQEQRELFPVEGQILTKLSNSDDSMNSMESKPNGTKPNKFIYPYVK